MTQTDGHFPFIRSQNYAYLF